MLSSNVESGRMRIDQTNLRFFISQRITDELKRPRWARDGSTRDPLFCVDRLCKGCFIYFGSRLLY